MSNVNIFLCALFHCIFAFINTRNKRKLFVHIFIHRTRIRNRQTPVIGTIVTFVYVVIIVKGQTIKVIEEFFPIIHISAYNFKEQEKFTSICDQNSMELYFRLKKNISKTAPMS